MNRDRSPFGLHKDSLSLLRYVTLLFWTGCVMGALYSASISPVSWSGPTDCSAFMRLVYPAFRLWLDVSGWRATPA